MAIKTKPPTVPATAPVLAKGTPIKDNSGKVVGTAQFNPNTGERLSDASTPKFDNRTGKSITGDYNVSQSGLVTTSDDGPKPQKVTPEQATIPPVPGLPQQQAPAPTMLSPEQKATNDAYLKNLGYDPTGKPLNAAYKTGLNNALASGQPAPTSEGDAKTAIQGFAPAPAEVNPIDAQLAQDPGWQEIQQMKKDFFDPQTQKVSLMDEYNKLYKAEGLKELDSEIIDAKTVIDGSEDDIRNEIQQAGGFGTDSQVQALALARNKVLLKNYNNLVAERESRQNHLDTMMNFTSQDRQYASQQADRAMNFEMQTLQYKDKFVNNTRDQLNSLGDKLGWDTVLKAYAADPRQLSFAEKILGVGPGGLNQLAEQSLTQRNQDLADRSLDRQYKQAQINKANQRDTSVIDVNGSKYLIDTQSGNVISQYGGNEGGMAGSDITKQNFSKDQVDNISSLLSTPYFANAVGPNALARVNVMNYFTGEKSNFIAGVEQLRSQLNLKALEDAKAQGATFGALSDAELQVLASSATKLGTWAVKDKNGNITGYKANPNDFKKELDKINNAAKLDYILKGGNPDDVGIVQTPDGHYWSKNSDNTVTQIK